MKKKILLGSFQNINAELPSPELTQVAVDYAQANEGFLQDRIAPLVSVNQDTFKYTVWGREDLKNVDRVERAVGAPANEVTKISKSYLDGVIEANALKDQIADEILQSARNPQQTKNKAVGSIIRKLKLGVELRMKALIDASTNTAAIGAAALKWGSASNTTIESDIDAAKKAMKANLGVPPNIMIIGQDVSNAIRRNAQIRELIKYNPNDLLTSGQIPSTIFGLQVIVAGAYYDAALPGAAASISDLWDDDTVRFLFVDPNAGDGVMTAILRFRNSGDAQPFATKEWRDPDLSRKVTWFSSEVRQTEKVVTPEAIYTLTDAL